MNWLSKRKCSNEANVLPLEPLEAKACFLPSWLFVDSTTLAYILNFLNQKYDYGLDLFLLSIDEGITGYRDESLETVKRNSKQYNLPLYILSYEVCLNIWLADERCRNYLVGRWIKFISIQKEPIAVHSAACSEDKYAVYSLLYGCRHWMKALSDTKRTRLQLVTMLMIWQKQVCVLTALSSTSDLEPAERRYQSFGSFLGGGVCPGRRYASLQALQVSILTAEIIYRLAYQREIVLYAHYKKLDYFSVECTYAPHAYRSHGIYEWSALSMSTSTRVFGKGTVDSTNCIMQYHFFFWYVLFMRFLLWIESFKADSKVKMNTIRRCVKCGCVSSQVLNSVSVDD